MVPERKLGGILHSSPDDDGSQITRNRIVSQQIRARMMRDLFATMEDARSHVVEIFYVHANFARPPNLRP